MQKVTPMDKIVDVLNMLGSKSNWKMIEHETGIKRGTILDIKRAYPLFAGLVQKRKNNREYQE